ncbi:MAG: Holliday junction branch migration protein RuvA [Saprospiraceae bacterium]|nr:Holliday junction branch migration protein RuvA [Saprospiraceae bacterium]
MIAYLQGKLTHKTPAFVYVDCNGVGYHVNISLNTYSKLENLDAIKIMTYMHTNDDGPTLYGFMDEAEREIFVLLISVSGVGPNTARVILSYMTTEETKSAVVHENVAALNKVKGIGPKTAKRIILDLKDKILKISGDQPLIITQSNNTVRNEALSALVALGFPKNSVEKQLKSILSTNPDIDQVEDIIKLVLKQMR